MPRIATIWKTMKLVGITSFTRPYSKPPSTEGLLVAANSMGFDHGMYLIKLRLDNDD
jgi:hypothetical protein